MLNSFLCMVLYYEPVMHRLSSNTWLRLKGIIWTPENLNNRSRVKEPLLLFRHFWAHCSCPNAQVTRSITAPAHPHATGVTVYPALFHFESGFWIFTLSVYGVRYYGSIVCDQKEKYEARWRRMKSDTTANDKSIRWHSPKRENFCRFEHKKWRTNAKCKANNNKNISIWKVKNTDKLPVEKRRTSSRQNSGHEIKEIAKKNHERYWQKKHVESGEIHIGLLNAIHQNSRPSTWNQKYQQQLKMPWGNLYRHPVTSHGAMPLSDVISSWIWPPVGAHLIRKILENAFRTSPGLA